MVVASSARYCSILAMRVNAHTAIVVYRQGCLDDWLTLLTVFWNWKRPIVKPFPCIRSSPPSSALSREHTLALGWLWHAAQITARYNFPYTYLGCRISVTWCLIGALHSDTFHIYFNIFFFGFFVPGSVHSFTAFCHDKTNVVPISYNAYQCNLRVLRPPSSPINGTTIPFLACFRHSASTT